MNRSTPGFGKAPAKPPAKAGGFGAAKPQQQSSAPKASYQSGQGQRGPWARLSGGLPTGQGGTNVFFYPSKDPLKISIAATSWSKAQGQCSNPQCPNKNRALRADITKTNILYENGVVKIPLAIRMKIPQNDALQFSTEVLEATQEAAAEEASSSESD